MKKTIITSIITTILTCGLLFGLGHMLCLPGVCGGKDAGKCPMDSTAVTSKDCCKEGHQGHGKCAKHNGGESHAGCCKHGESEGHPKCGKHGDHHGAPDHSKLHKDIFEKLVPERTAFDSELSDEEKATIKTVKETLAEVDHENLKNENVHELMKQYESEFNTLNEIVANHQESIDKIFAAVMEEMNIDEHATGHGHGDSGEHAEGSEEGAPCKAIDENRMNKHQQMFTSHFLIMDY